MTRNPLPRDTWAMGQTLRWHSSEWPALRNSGDTVDAHQNRMIRDARLYFPRAGMELVDAIIAHDLPECLSGDYSTPEKDIIPGLRASLAAVDCLVLAYLGFDDIDNATAERVKWLDVLDAYKWARLHEPRAMTAGGFPAARVWLDGQAWALGIQGIGAILATLEGGE